MTESSFARGNETWSAEDANKRPLSLNYNAVAQAISVSQPDNYGVFFLAPRRFLGDQRASYNQDLEFKLRVSDNSPVPARDIIIEGAALTISQPIFGQKNPLPTTQVDVLLSYQFFFFYILCRTKNIGFGYTSIMTTGGSQDLMPAISWQFCLI